MSHEDAIDDIVRKICKIIDPNNTSSGDGESVQKLEQVKIKAETLQKYREADDETYRSFIWELLSGLLDENDDYKADDNTVIYISPQDKAFIVEQVFGTYRGLGIVDTLLMDEEITELMINGPDNIFVEKKGHVIRLNQKFCNDTDCSDEERFERGKVQLRKIIHRIVDICGREVNEASPIVDARLKDGS